VPWYTDHKTLLRKELISLSRSSGDRRNVHLEILPAGLAVLGQVSGPFEGVLPLALGKLPQRTLQRLDRDLGQLIGLLKADEEAAGFQPAGYGFREQATGKTSRRTMNRRLDVPPKRSGGASQYR
jgi:hypothetical protein